MGSVQNYVEQTQGTINSPYLNSCNYVHVAFRTRMKLLLEQSCILVSHLSTINQTLQESVNILGNEQVTNEERIHELESTKKAICEEVEAYDCQIAKLLESQEEAIAKAEKLEKQYKAQEIFTKCLYKFCQTDGKQSFYYWYCTNVKQLNVADFNELLNVTTVEGITQLLVEDEVVDMTELLDFFARLQVSTTILGGEKILQITEEPNNP